jgi:hypothetical protein
MVAGCSFLKLPVREEHPVVARRVVEVLVQGTDAHAGDALGGGLVDAVGAQGVGAAAADHVAGHRLQMQLEGVGRAPIWALGSSFSTSVPAAA